MHIIHINSDFSFSGLPHYLFPYKKHEKSQNGCQNNRMFEQILLLKIDSKFHGCFSFHSYDTYAYTMTWCSNVWGR